MEFGVSSNYPHQRDYHIVLWLWLFKNLNILVGYYVKEFVTLSGLLGNVLCFNHLLVMFLYKISIKIIIHLLVLVFHTFFFFKIVSVLLVFVSQTWLFFILVSILQIFEVVHSAFLRHEGKLKRRKKMWCITLASKPKWTRKRLCQFLLSVE